MKKLFLVLMVLAGVMDGVMPAVAQSQSVQSTLTINVAAPLKITTTALPAGVVGQVYAAQLAATGGVPPYTYSLATGSALPAGVTLSATGAFGGTPTAAGSTSFGILAKDSGTASAVRMFGVRSHGGILKKIKHVLTFGHK